MQIAPSSKAKKLAKKSSATIQWVARTTQSHLNVLVIHFFLHFTHVGWVKVDLYALVVFVIAIKLVATGLGFLKDFDFVTHCFNLGLCLLKINPLRFRLFCTLRIRQSVECAAK